MSIPLNVMQANVECTISADIKDVWYCLVNETTKWWRKDFYTNNKTKGFYIDDSIGGKAYEDFGDGEGLVWAEVIGVDSPNTLQLKGFLAPDFGGPAISYLTIRLKLTKKGTLLELTDSLFGAISESTTSQIESGWRMIYAEAFKSYVEHKNSLR